MALRSTSTGPTGDGAGALKRLGVLARAAGALVAGGLLYLRFAPDGAVAVGGVALATAALLVPPGVGAPGRAKERVARRLGPVAWPARVGVLALAALVYLTHLDAPPWPQGVVHLPGRVGVTPERVVLSPDGRFLYLTHGQGGGASMSGGVSRYDLDSGTVKHHRVDDGGPDIELLPAVNRVYVASYGPDGERTPVFAYQADPFSYLGESLCARPALSRVAAFPGGRALVVAKDGSSFVAADALRPCQTEIATSRIDLNRRGVVAPRFAVPLPDDPATVWFVGEMGGRMCLARPAEGRVLRCVWSGPVNWGGAVVHPAGTELWLNQTVLNRVWIFDPRDGSRKGVVAPLPGLPRAIAFDADGRRAFVGLYNSRRIVVVDVAARRVVGELRAGQRVRSLVYDARRRQLIAATAEGIHLYPEAVLEAAVASM